MIVMKFGGSSIGTAEAMFHVVGIISRYKEFRPVVVVSALQGVTDALLALAENALCGKREEVEAGIAVLRVRHLDTLLEVDGVDSGVRAQVEKLLAELMEVLRGVAMLRELSPRSRDLVVSFGERLSVPIVVAACRKVGLDAIPVDSRELIVTDDSFTRARVDFVATIVNTRRIIRPLLENASVPVITGFIAATKSGDTTTLGRGGSDYSVSIIAGTLEASEIWIWKEVDGVMTADPRHVNDAALISRLSYDEAAELSYFGAKVLHPKTMIPAVENRIPIRLRNTFNPEAPGTVIGFESEAALHGVKAVTAVFKLAIVTIEGKGMAGIAGFAAQVFSVAGKAKVNVLMFTQSSSEQNICLVIEEEDAAVFKKELEEALREQMSTKEVDRVAVESGVAAVAVVGDGMRGSRGVAARVFGAVAESGGNVLAIAQGSSERNISFMVRESEAVPAVRAIHAAFELHAVSGVYAKNTVPEGRRYQAI